MRIKNKVKNIVKQCIITYIGRLCLERNIFNNYVLIYAAFRLVELITTDIYTNINILKNSNNISDLIQF